MKRCGLLAALLLGAYLLSGFYIVAGNEKAVVRRFGRVVRTSAGNVDLRGSGWHYDLPWPLSQVDRVNFNEVRTLTVGRADAVALEPDAAGFLQSMAPRYESQFLTGDKNILNVEVIAQYRISAAAPDAFLFRSESPEARLKLIVESVTTDLIARSGVDFVHPLGLGELREMLTARVREQAERQQLGLEVDEVAINAVYPPVQVKAYFLDVSNARADKEKYIQAALAYEWERQETARAEAQQTLDEANIFRRQRIEQARGEADSFLRVISEFQHEASRGGQTYAQARQMALRRAYVETMQDVLRRVAGKVFLDSGKPVDLTIFRDPNE